MKSKLLGGIIWDILQKECNKDEIMTIQLMQNWEKIMGDLAAISKPERITLKNELLLIRVKPGYAMMMQYQHDKIKDIVNMFFGREYITKIIMKNELI